MRLPLALVAACLATAACGPAQAPIGAPPPDDVVRDGSQVIGTGRVVALPEQEVRLCADGFGTDIGWPEGQEPAPRSCEHGVDVRGVDLASLADRREKDGAVEGRATLTGTWSDGRLVVEEQEPPQPRPGSEDAQIIGSTHYSPTDSPCPLPEGLPPTDLHENLDHAAAAREEFFRLHPGSDAFSALRRPAPDQVVYALGVQGDAERQDAERLLRPVLGERLCLVDARVTPEQVEAAVNDPAFAVGPGPDLAFGAGQGISDDGTLTPIYRVDVVMVTEQLRAAADAHPEGLVEFHPLVAVVP